MCVCVFMGLWLNGKKGMAYSKGVSKEIAVLLILQEFMDTFDEKGL